MQSIVAPEVAAALSANRPVVALESTIISHGLPRPQNLAAAIEFEAIVREHGATPATIAVLDGVPRIGLSEAERERIANEEIVKASVRDLAVLAAKGLSGATTVAATAHIARSAGIRVFATGGLGGVHREANLSFDESADITTLAHTPITVVCAGVKSVLDISATLERLESLSVPVLGYQTSTFPAFWLTSSGIAIDWRADSPSEIADVMRRQDALGHRQGIVVANPLPTEKQWSPSEHDAVLAQALTAAKAQAVTGKAVTPFLLSYIVEASNGKSLEVNLDLVRSNIVLAARIAVAWCDAD